MTQEHNNIVVRQQNILQTLKDSKETALTKFTKLFNQVHLGQDIDMW